MTDFNIKITSKLINKHPSFFTKFLFLCYFSYVISYIDYLTMNISFNKLYNKKVQLTKNPIVTDNLHLYQTIYTFIKVD